MFSFIHFCVLLLNKNEENVLQIRRACLALLNCWAFWSVNIRNVFLFLKNLECNLERIHYSNKSLVLFTLCFAYTKACVLLFLTNRGDNLIIELLHRYEYVFCCQFLNDFLKLTPVFSLETQTEHTSSNLSPTRFKGMSWKK